MKPIDYRTIDKTSWGGGPWDDEPDKAQWPDPTTGFPCLAVRNYYAGNWCGYVGVPLGHPWHGRGYDTVDVRVHGGLTFSDACRSHDHQSWEAWKGQHDGDREEARRHLKGDAAKRMNDPLYQAALQSYDAYVELGRARGICHLPDSGEPDDVWWLGFDCAHLGDLSPGIIAALRELGSDGRWHDGDRYRDLRYVRRECAVLAAQIAAARP